MYTKLGIVIGLTLIGFTGSAQATHRLDTSNSPGGIHTVNLLVPRPHFLPPVSNVTPENMKVAGAYWGFQGRTRKGH